MCVCVCIYMCVCVCVNANQANLCSIPKYSKLHQRY